MTGPTGKVMLMPEEKADTDYIMVATGTGIAPYRGFIRRLFTETTPAGVVSVKRRRMKPRYGAMPVPVATMM